MYLQIIFFIIYFLSSIEFFINKQKEKERNKMIKKQFLVLSVCTISVAVLYTLKF